MWPFCKSLTDHFTVPLSSDNKCVNKRPYFLPYQLRNSFFSWELKTLVSYHFFHQQIPSTDSDAALTTSPKARLSSTFKYTLLSKTFKPTRSTTELSLKTINYWRPKSVLTSSPTFFWVLFSESSESDSNSAVCKCQIFEKVK